MPEGIRKLDAKGSKAALPRWKLEDAKARFSALVRAVRSDGPQCVTVHGKDAVVVMPAQDYHRLCIRHAHPTLRGLLVNSPLADVEIGGVGVKSPVRDVEL